MASIDAKDIAESTGPINLDALLARVVAEGRLAELIERACALAASARGDEDEEGEPTGASEAIRAYRDHETEPEILPRAHLGKWVAWSADGLRIVGVGETIEEAERLASEAGETDPILHRPMALK